MRDALRVLGPHPGAGKFISSIPDLARGTTYYGRYLKVNAGVTGRITFYTRLSAGARTITEKLGSYPDRDGITDREIEELQERFDSRVGTLLALREQGKL